MADWHHLPVILARATAWSHRYTTIATIVDELVSLMVTSYIAGCSCFSVSLVYSFALLYFVMRAIIASYSYIALAWWK